MYIMTKILFIGSIKDFCQLNIMWNLFPLATSNRCVYTGLHICVCVCVQYILVHSFKVNGNICTMCPNSNENNGVKNE